MARKPAKAEGEWGVEVGLPDIRYIDSYSVGTKEHAEAWMKEHAPDDGRVVRFVEQPAPGTARHRLEDQR